MVVFGLEMVGQHEESEGGPEAIPTRDLSGTAIGRRHIFHTWSVWGFGGVIEMWGDSLAQWIWRPSPFWSEPVVFSPHLRPSPVRGVISGQDTTNGFGSVSPKLHSSKESGHRGDRKKSDEEVRAFSRGQNRSGLNSERTAGEKMVAKIASMSNMSKMRATWPDVTIKHFSCPADVHLEVDQSTSSGGHEVS